jgi:hypothetical protein
MFIRISYASQNKILLGWPQDLGTAPNPTRRAVGRGAVFEGPTIPTTPPHRPQGVHEGLGRVTLSVFLSTGFPLPGGRRALFSV